MFMNSLGAPSSSSAENDDALPMPSWSSAFPGDVMRNAEELFKKKILLLWIVATDPLFQMEQHQAPLALLAH
jgi:hypothetical protein